ncbi:MAG TPA: thioredoxin family protein [Pedobacter sp.]|uniref:thioredoxin family protein n=1 Tax=Pedobacter sp. TaxID=1411316 RepID=UPI002BF76931|nr:thioredoxin family protein [Pedobacter sp.]HMI02260.1 thioredoxin family protein [Pedobacter sp.]
MKPLAILLVLFTLPPLIWTGNFDEALAKAKTSHKKILINFSGSDWCGPCIRLRKEILETVVFEKYAEEHLIPVRADFPRQKKNKLPAAQLKLNEEMAELYNPDGKFPFTLLVDENGKVLKTWDGFPNESPENFVKEISDLLNSK